MGRVFLESQAREMEIAEGAEHRLVRRQGIFVLVAQHFAHGARQDAMVGHSGDDTGDQVVLND